MSDFTQPIITEPVLRAFLTIVFAAGGVAFVLNEARELILRKFHGERVPDPEPTCIVNQPPGESVGEWHLGGAA